MTTLRIGYLMICLTAHILLIQNRGQAGSRKELPNEVNFELGGKCLLYSFSYQRMLEETFGIEAGFSMIGGDSSGTKATVWFFTVGGKFYVIQGNASPYVGGGIVALTASTRTGPLSSSASAIYGYLGPGFEFRWDGSFLVRGSVYALIVSRGFLVWPGLSVGVTF